tara:strand:+ start:2520 stop:3017 length:498 start_codon:yes stop_codon:yes gene_type:complete
MKKGIGPLGLGSPNKMLKKGAPGSMALLGKKKKRKAVKSESATAYEKQRMRKQAEKEAFKKERSERIAGERASLYEQKPTKGVSRKADRKNEKKADKLRDKQTRLAGESQKAKENLKSIYDSQGVPRNERTTVQRMSEGKGELIPGSNRPSMTAATNPYKMKKRK